VGKYSADARDALADIRADGATITFTRQGSVIDPVTQTSVDTSTTYEAPMLGIALSAGKARHVFGEGADITKPRLSVTIALYGLEVEPRNGDRFTWGGKTYALMNVEVLDPAGDGGIIATGYAEAA
jgi:glycerol kinase